MDEARAMINLQVQQSQVKEYKSKLSSSYFNANLKSELAANDYAMHEAAEEAAKQEKALRKRRSRQPPAPQRRVPEQKTSGQERLKDLGQLGQRLRTAQSGYKPPANRTTIQ